MKTKKKILLGTKKKRRRGVSPPSSRALRSVRDWPVHQLWPLLGDTRRTDLDIVFFHGLQLTANDSRNAWFTTWTERDRDHVCWPQKWLPDDLGQAVRVFSVSYNTHVELCPHDHVSEIADNLFQIFVGSRYKWQHPIVLVGHSIGGLVLKSLVLKLKRGSTIRSPSDPYSEVASKRAKAFLKNLSGVAFYAVPHAGSINFHTFVNKLLKCPDRPCLGIMENIKPYRRDMNQLSVDFDDIVNENKINIYAFSEGKPMDQEQEVLVEFSSAQQLARNFCYKVEDANHMEVCKPPSKGHPSYGLLLQFINDCHEVSRKFEEALQEVRDLRLSTFGMEFELQTVERLLTSSGDDVAPKYVRVCGMGGVGKTRFLEILYASSKVHDHFRGVQFIRRSLGHKPDILSVYRSLSVEFDLEPNLYLNEKEYKPILLSLFKQRRVFLVIDDVWKEQAFNALDLAQGKGSVTLFSTRDQSLFKRASSQISEVHLTTLSEKESWSLFCVNAFAPGCNVPFDLVELSKSMAAECQGLPLALKVIGGAMRGKISPELEWEPQLNKLRASCMHEEIVDEELYDFLKIGYDLLSDRMKQCFHYFAAFPERSNIVFEEILCHWTGEGLVPERYGGNPRADAFTLLKKLWEKSFIESNRQFDSDECHLLNFKVHDVMRDLAFHVLEKDCGQLYLYRPGQNLEEIPQEWKAISKSPGSERSISKSSQSESVTILKALRLSLDTNKFATLPKFYAPELLFLLLGGNPIISIPADFSSYFPNLSVLNLRNGEFHNLPDELGNLKNMVCLDLSNCHELEVLPATIRKLHKMKFLILDDCWSLKCLPYGMVHLTSLQVLHTAHCVCLTWAEDTVARTARAKFGEGGASLSTIWQLPLLTELTIFPQDHPVLWQSNPPRHLPDNISLTKLQFLQICLDIENLPAEMAKHFTHLREFELRSSLLKQLPTSFTCRGGFPTLRKLKLSCKKLVEFPEVEKHALPALRTLDLTHCSSLKILPLSLKQLTNLSTLIVEYCNDEFKDSCRVNCGIASIRRKLDIQCSNNVKDRLDVASSRKYTFSGHNSSESSFAITYMQWERRYLNREMRRMRRERRYLNREMRKMSRNVN